MRSIKKLNVQRVYDLQNSSRTKFYQKILFLNSNSNKWSSSETTLPNDKTKEEFDKKPVLDRFEHQLKTSGLSTKNTMFPDFSWACSDIKNLKDENLLPTLLQPKDGGFSNLCFLLGCSNWILAGNAYMNPWVHLQTISQNFRAVPLGASLIAEMEINNIYEKKGHEFIDVFVNLFDEKDESCVMSINLIAIYKLRGVK